MQKISKSPRINYLLIQLYTYLLSKWNELLFAIAKLFIYEDMCGYVNGIYNSNTPTFLPHTFTMTQLLNHYFHIFKLEYKYKIRILSSMNPLYCLKYFQTWRIIHESLNTLIFKDTTARDKCNGGPTTENWRLRDELVIGSTSGAATGRQPHSWGTPVTGFPRSLLIFNFKNAVAPSLSHSWNLIGASILDLLSCALTC